MQLTLDQVLLHRPRPGRCISMMPDHLLQRGGKVDGQVFVRRFNLADNSLPHVINNREQTIIIRLAMVFFVHAFIGFAGLFIGATEDDREIPDRLIQDRSLKHQLPTGGATKIMPLGAGAALLVTDLLLDLLGLDIQESDMGKDIIDF